MTQNEKISVVVPVYNVEPYIEKCIDSILAQTYRNMEVLLIDDGSTDNCGKICDKYAKLDSRVIVHHKENEGLSEARNVGVRLASGTYIAFVDSDDYIEPDMLAVMHQRLQQDKSDLAICNFVCVDTDGVLVPELNSELPIKDEVISGEEAFERLAEEKYWYYVTAWNKLYRKEFLDGISFPKGKLHEDEFIAHYVLDRCGSVSCVSKTLYRYVQRENSITKQTFSARRLDGVEAFCERIEYARKKKNRRVVTASFAKAGTLLVEGYRRLGKEKKYRDVLKERRRLYCKVYLKVFFYRLGIKNRVKGTLVFLHPCVALKIMDWF